MEPTHGECAAGRRPPRRSTAACERRGAAIVLGSRSALLLLLVAYPLLWLVLAALGIPGTLTFDHLARVATRAQNLESLVNTLQLAVGTGLLSIALGVPLAWATARSDMPLRRSCTLWSRSPTSRRPTSRRSPTSS